MRKYLIIIIAIILDGLIPNITLFNFNNITYYSPICTGVSLIFLYNDDKTFYKLLLFCIFTYGTLYINNLFLSLTVFGLIFLFLKIIKKTFKDNFVTIVVQILLVVIIWDITFFIFYSLIEKNFMWNNYFYKLGHSILFNIIYGIVLFKTLNKKKF